MEQRRRTTQNVARAYYNNFMHEVTDLYARLVAKWMSVGFIHGVMNTDNASIGGLTIDYGPCAFMEEYVGSKVFSRIDNSGRYAFDKQPAMAKWNIGKLVESFLNTSNSFSMFDADYFKKYFDNAFELHYYNIMREKFGLRGGVPDEKVKDLISRFYNIMEIYRLDFTNTFRTLADNQTFVGNSHLGPKFQDWEILWLTTRDSDNQQRQKRMQLSCPVYVSRNHLVQQAIDQTLNGDYHMFRHMLQVLKAPYFRQEGAEYLTQPATDANRVTFTTCGT